MKLTVALRVIGGFAIISLLLLLISGFSLRSLFSISGAAEEMNQLALPTLKGSSQLRVSFLEMGRLTVEAYYEKNSEELQSKLTHFNQNKEVFDREFAALRSVLSTKPTLSSSLKGVDNIYQQYLKNVEDIFNNRIGNLNLKAKLNDIVGNIEDNSDDASTLILDFQDLDEVQADSRLSQAAELGGELESTLLSLLTVSLDYTDTDTLIRAETVGNEVQLIVDQISQQMAEMQKIADGKDSSGTLNEAAEMVEIALSAVRSPNGLMQTQLDSLNHQVSANKALKLSEQNIQQASVELSKLLGQAEKLAFSAEEEMNAQVSGGTTLVIVIFLVAIVVAVGIAWASVRSITVPLAKVNDVLHVVSSGDLTQKLDDSSDDEFGELAESVNNLIDSLKSLISGISSRASQLAAASEQTSAVTTQTTASIQDQKSQVGQVAAATAQMHSTSQMVTQSADDTLSQIRHADSEAEKVKVISLENKRTIEVLAADVEEAAQVINKLHQDSASIGGILDVIRGVADQTNLLALNAAIEAARAGEQGRGFAVVADEVRTLASRTQESTQEINAMIEVLQAGAEKAVFVMNQGKEQTTVCVEQTEKATQALELITSAVHKAHDVSTQIEQSAREQNLVSQEISEKLENIVGISEETASGAQQTSDSSLEVAKLAEELQGSIRQFKV